MNLGKEILPFENQSNYYFFKNSNKNSVICIVKNFFYITSRFPYSRNQAHSLFFPITTHI